MKTLIKLLPSYVGSKAYWVNVIREQYPQLIGRKFVEPFAGSAVLSANLAGTCVLNDLDPFVYKILSDFEGLIVPDEFSDEDYYRVRSQADWWRYAYCLQRMSFSGVFRYSEKSGYNVPIKHRPWKVNVRPEYEAAVIRYKELKPIVLNRQYHELDEYITEDSVLVLDPPYAGAVAAYNEGFDTQSYWNWVSGKLNMCVVVIFDFESNIVLPCRHERKSRVNGKYSGDTEVMYVNIEPRTVMEELLGV